MKRYFVRIQVGIILSAIVLFGFYGVHIRQYQVYKQYNGMQGVVISTFKARTCNLINVRLHNGYMESVNVGYSTYKVGDTFRNNVQYDRIMGISGTAYFITPNDIRSFFESMTVIFVYLFLVIFIFYKYISYLIKNWNKKDNL